MSYLRKKLSQKLNKFNMHTDAKSVPSNGKFTDKKIAQILMLINITQAVATATLIITMGLLACSIAGIHLPSHVILVGWLLCFVISSILIM